MALQKITKTILKQMKMMLHPLNQGIHLDT
jgi:hypothetical protein